MKYSKIKLFLMNKYLKILKFFTDFKEEFTIFRLIVNEIHEMNKFINFFISLLNLSSFHQT
jgi:hypothetical protein